MRNPGGGSKKKTLRSKNLDKSSQAMPITETAEENTEGAFPSKRDTFESSSTAFVENSFTQIGTNNGFPMTGSVF